ncbi:MAG: VOC family protein [Armatimonadota bacterium]|nr:VOC family protein [Armatimonadota bacterium]MDR7444662.1 VOC family protein [Armatimonadota bacterium]MDR7569488.1 VOC family protein [Armatimonadota bacterium]MDR7613629.1 VOC family protein [Armatimonadota bacterium]
MIRGLDNIGVAVSEVRRAVSFYQLLGFQPDYVTEDSAFLRAEGVALYLFRTEAPPPPSRSFDLTGNPLGLDHLSFRVDDVDAACAALRDLGVTIERPPRDYEWGARAACLRDPDGNCIWLLQRRSP